MKRTLVLAALLIAIAPSAARAGTYDVVACGPAAQMEP